MNGNSADFSRNIFVLDVSGSMGGMKCQTLQLSVNRMIEEIPDNSYVGIVSFNHYTKRRHRVVQITDRSVRDSLINRVPLVATGSTDIGRGILGGVDAFRKEGIVTEGATMFLVTDGEDTTGTDYVSNVLPTLIEAKMPLKVVCIAIGNAADPNLERLAKGTNGSTYYTDGTNREMIARVIESTIQEVKTSKEMAEVINICICDDIIRLNRNKVSKNVTIDSDIGRNTVFIIASENFDKISVSIRSPNGHNYDMISPQLIRNSALKRFQLKVPSAEPGVWSISLNKHSNETIIGANISVKSQPINPNAIQMKVSLKDADSNSPPIIICEIRKGSAAVIGAEVTATVDKPNGTQSQLKLINYNNIYCNYFTDYCGSGRYNVTVLAQNNGSNCRLNSLTSRTGVNQMVPNFERQQIAGCFKIDNYTPPRPLDDHKLEQSSLCTSFNSLSFNCTVGSVEVPAPRTAKAVIKPKLKAVLQTDDIIKAKEKINNLVLLLKKSINSSKISDNERNALKKSLEENDKDFNSKTIQELNVSIKRLEDFKRKIF